MLQGSEIGAVTSGGPFGQPPQSKYENLISLAREVPPATTVIVHPCDETSLRGAVVGFWMGTVVPAATSKDIIEFLRSQIAAVMGLADVKQRLAALGFAATVSTPEEFANHIKAEFGIWSKVAHDANIRID